MLSIRPTTVKTTTTTTATVRKTTTATMPTTYSSSNEVRSYQIDKDTIVLFDGSKSFFGSRSNLIILIVEHLDAKCIEMIVVDSLANSSAPRIYMNSNKLRNKFIKQKQIKLHELIDEYEKRFESYNITEITSKVETVLIVDYIISKLSFLSELPTGTVKDSFNPKFGQTVVDVVCEFYSKNLDVVCEKPSHLRPMEISDYKAGG